MSEKYHTEKSAAEFIGYSKFTLRNWRIEKDKNCPKYTKNKRGRVVYLESDLISWLEGE